MKTENNNFFIYVTKEILDYLEEHNFTLRAGQIVESEEIEFLVKNDFLKITSKGIKNVEENFIPPAASAYACVRCAIDRFYFIDIRSSDFGTLKKLIMAQF